jgi:hypothetical protein
MKKKELQFVSKTSLASLCGVSLLHSVRMWYLLIKHSFSNLLKKLVVIVDENWCNQHPLVY